MKRILAIVTVVLMTVTSLPVLQLWGNAADEQLILATVGDNNTHLNPGDYEATLKKYKNGKLKEVRSWSGAAWKNDYATSRLDFFTYDEAIPDAELVTTDLTDGAGNKISKENFKATYLGKVNTLSEAYPGIDYEVFDVITRKSVKDLDAGQIHEAWVEIYVPEDTAAGTYSGTVSLYSGAQKLAEFEYELEVIDLTLTDPDEWDTYLELWTTPHASNRYYSGLSNAEYFGFDENDNSTNPYSYRYVYLNREYEAGMESELEMYAKAGGDVITVFVVEDGGNSRNPCPCPSMVKMTKKRDGSFEFDYTDMDYWVELNMKHGIDTQINLHGLTGVGYGFVYEDEATGKVMHENGDPGSPKWVELSRAFLVDMVAHLEEKGWFDITCLQMDERTLEQTSALIELAKSVTNSEGKSLKVCGAVNDLALEPLFDDLHDISIWEVSLPENIRELCDERREKGLLTTVYTCGAGKMSTPCNPGEAAYAVYDSLKYNTDGILRWALNKFDEDPLYAECHKVTYPGDCYLVYPDEPGSTDMQAQSTPRFEKLCEGMRNAEKLHIIRENYPDFSGTVDSLVASLTDKDLALEARKMNSRIHSLSRSALAFEQGQYTDIVDGKWYTEAVRFATGNGLMQGVSDTQFVPDGAMTRAMFVTVLSRLHFADVDNSDTARFSDVPTGKWYTGAIVWGTKNGLIAGVSDDCFAPNSTLTREQTATILYRYAKRNKYNTAKSADLSGYDDADDIHSYALEAMSWANAMGIIRGTSATTLAPRNNCTRAQVAEMIRLFCENVVNQ